MSQINKIGLPEHFQSMAYGGGSREQGPSNTNYNLRGAGCPTFRNKTNIFDDPCTVNVRENQSIDTGDYQVTNFFRTCGQPVMTDCMVNSTLTYPKVYSPDRCNIDRDTDFKYPPLTNLRNVQQLFTRPYLSQGYRGAGANNLHLKDMESGLMQGNMQKEKKGCRNPAEVYIDRFEYLPEYGNPQRLDHVIQPFMRQGANTRDLVRSLSYPDYCHMIGKGRAY
jgi:hypothetical protein